MFKVKNEKGVKKANGFMKYIQYTYPHLTFLLPLVLEAYAVFNLAGFLSSFSLVTNS
jgi:hypothetical protein